MYNEAEACHDVVHGLFSGAATAMMVGVSNARAANERRRANEFACGQAAAAARGAVLSETAFALRERLADAEDDVARLTAERDDLERKLRLLATEYQRLRAETRVAA